MGEYADVKSKKLINAIKKLINKSTDLELLPGGRHNCKLHCIHNGQSFPIPTSHKYIDKYIVKDIAEILERWDICTIDEFKKNL